MHRIPKIYGLFGQAFFDQTKKKRNVWKFRAQTWIIFLGLGHAQRQMQIFLVISTFVRELADFDIGI